MLTKKEKELLNNAFEDTWQAIGGDVIAVSGDDQVPKDVVMEMVDDAGRIGNHTDLDKKILKKFESLEYNQRMRILNKHFTFDFYGY